MTRDSAPRSFRKPSNNPRYIAENAGVDGAVVVSRIRKSADPKFGYDAETGAWGDMFAAGIVDPTKVTRSALQNGASVACLLLTTEALVAEPPKKKEPAGHGDPPSRWRRYGWHGWHGWNGGYGWHGNDVISPAP